MIFYLTKLEPHIVNQRLTFLMLEKIIEENKSKIKERLEKAAKPAQGESKGAVEQLNNLRIIQRLGDKFENEDCIKNVKDLNVFQASDGGIKQVNWGASDLETTFWATYIDPNQFDKNRLISYFEQNENTLFGSWGLTILGKPKINKIIIAYNFGGANMNISNFTLYGPDGKTGKDDTDGCNVKGGDGEDAFRLNITAPDITIGDFTLYLGYGGKGGFAETDQDCDHGQATGGAGGNPSNFKIIGTNSLKVVGAFTINPGQGGQGGQAIAHGKNGKDGCPGENGGEATATGGRGGNNKKGLKKS